MINGNAESVIDFNGLARRLSERGTSVRVGDTSRACAIVEQLRSLPLPPGYVDSLRDDVLHTLRDGMRHVDPIHVYLAFFGENNAATHLKIGVARNVRSRINTIRTGNPLPNLWTFAALYGSRKEAMLVESALLEHMAADSVHGEWISVGSIAKPAVSAIVESLAEVAAVASKYKSHFDLEWGAP